MNDANSDLGQIVDRASSDLIDRTIIEGGHYIIRYEGNHLVHYVDSVSLLTFCAAVALYSKSKTLLKKTGFSFLVSDLGVPAEERRQFDASFHLPRAYTTTLSDYGLKDEEILFFYESTLRNRAQRTLKVSVKKGDVVEADDSYRVSVQRFGVFSDDVVSNHTESLERRVPNCRMILAQQLKDKEGCGFKRAVGFYNHEAYLCNGSFAQVYKNIFFGGMGVVTYYFFKNGRIGRQEA